RASNVEFRFTPPSRRPAAAPGGGGISTDPWPRDRGETPMDDDSNHRNGADFDDDDAPQPEVARIRRKVHSAGRDGRVRSKTIAPKRLTRDERRLSELLVYPSDIDRPATREACQGMGRPCPFV